MQGRRRSGRGNNSAGHDRDSGLCNRVTAVMREPKAVIRTRSQNT